MTHPTFSFDLAEQNSLDLSWDLLMRREYDSLRAFLFPTKSCLVRFRQVSAGFTATRRFRHVDGHPVATLLDTFS